LFMNEWRGLSMRDLALRPRGCGDWRHGSATQSWLALFAPLPVV
jgi:hypothetical protein